MACGKKKPKKFAAGGATEGGWSTSVSFDEKDAAERVKKWAEEHKKKPAAKPAAKAAPTPIKFPKAEQEAIRGGGAMGANGYKAPTPEAAPKKWSNKMEIDTGAPMRPFKKFGERVAARTEKNKAAQAPKSITAKYEPTMGKSIGAWWKKAKEGSARIKAGQKSYAKGGKVRGDGCASKGKTKGRMC